MISLEIETELIYLILPIFYFVILIINYIPSHLFDPLILWDCCEYGGFPLWINATDKEDKYKPLKTNTKSCFWQEHFKVFL